MPWKAPYRTGNEVTQSYNDGLVTVYSVTNTAQPGYQPKPALTKKVTLRYEEQRMGIQRFYSGKQNQVELERVIRTPRLNCVSNQDVAVTEDGRQYRIDMVQSVSDIWPASMDLTLARVTQQYDVSGLDTGEGNV